MMTQTHSKPSDIRCLSAHLRRWLPISALGAVVALGGVGCTETNEQEGFVRLDGGTQAEVEVDTESSASAEATFGASLSEGMEPARTFEGRLGLTCRSDKPGQLFASASDIRDGFTEVIALRIGLSEPVEGTYPITAIDDGTDCPAGSARIAWSRQSDAALTRAIAVDAGTLQLDSAAPCSGTFEATLSILGPGDDPSSLVVSNGVFELP